MMDARFAKSLVASNPLLEIKTINFSDRECVIEKGEMEKGIYFVEIMDGNKNVVKRKIVVQ